MRQVTLIGPCNAIGECPDPATQWRVMVHGYACIHASLTLSVDSTEAQKGVIGPLRDNWALLIFKRIIGGMYPLTPKPQNLIFSIFFVFLRVIGGILDTTGTTLTDYQPKPRSVTLKQSKFHDFAQILAYSGIPKPLESSVP